MGDLLLTVNVGAGRTVKAIGAGLKCSGPCLEGELGQGHKVYRGDNPGEMGDLLPAINLGH